MTVGPPAGGERRRGGELNGHNHLPVVVIKRIDGLQKIQDIKPLLPAARLGVAAGHGDEGGKQEGKVIQLQVKVAPQDQIAPGYVLDDAVDGVLGF